MSHKLNNIVDKTFPKEERLNSKKLIQELFEEGSSFYLYPFKLITLPNPDKDSKKHQILISVSKKKFSRAVDRNLIKRRIRESYRLNKHFLYSEERAIKPLLIAYIYIGKEIHDFRLIQSKLIKSIHRLMDEASKS